MHAPNENAGAKTRQRGSGLRRMALGRAPRTRSVLLATGVLAVGITPFAVAATGDPLAEGQRNGTTRAETEIIGNISKSSGQKGGFVTRQSNIATGGNAGGAVIYGCRAPSGNPACVRANNLSSGAAFGFETNGNIGGTIVVGESGGDSTKPFITNATGVATGLNADRLDGADLQQILAASSADAQQKANAAAVAAGTAAATVAKSRWFLLNEAGEIEQQSGGFTVIDAYDATPNVYVDAGDDLTDNGLNATIALQNLVDQDGADDDAEPSFTGLVSVAQCQVEGIVNCAPDDAKNANALVVAPRKIDESTGEVTDTKATPDDRKRVYVSVTGQAPPTS